MSGGMIDVTPPGEELAELRKMRTETIVSMSWLEEMNPNDQPTYAILKPRLKALDKRIKELEQNEKPA